MPKVRQHKLVLGFAHWGTAIVPPSKMMETVEFAVTNGVDEIDCAPHYGDGAQESVLGVSLMALPEQLRSQIKISTKVGRVIDPMTKAETDHGFSNSTGFAQSFDYTEKGIQTSFSQSQLRLSRGKVHALYIHDPDSSTHGSQFEAHYQELIESGYLALQKLKEQESTEIIGIGTNDIDICLKLIQEGRFKIDRIMLAGCYNLLNFSAINELFPLCKEKGIQLYIAAPYGGGILSAQPGNTFFRYEKAHDEILERLEKIKKICEQYHVDLRHAAMQFVHMHPQVERVVVGARTAEEFEVSLNYAKTPIQTAFWEALKAAELIPASTEITTKETIQKVLPIESYKRSADRPGTPYPPRFLDSDAKQKVSSPSDALLSEDGSLNRQLVEFN